MMLAAPPAASCGTARLLVRVGSAPALCAKVLMSPSVSLNRRQSCDLQRASSAALDALSDACWGAGEEDGGGLLVPAPWDAPSPVDEDECKYSRILRFVEDSNLTSSSHQHAPARRSASASALAGASHPHSMDLSYDEECWEEAEDDDSGRPGGQHELLMGPLLRRHQQLQREAAQRQLVVACSATPAALALARSSSRPLLSFAEEDDEEDLAPAFSGGQQAQQEEAAQQPVLCASATAAGPSSALAAVAAQRRQLKRQLGAAPAAARRALPPSFGDLEHMPAWIDTAAAAAEAARYERIMRFVEENAVAPLKENGRRMEELLACDYRSPKSWYLTFDEESHGMSFDETVLAST